MAKPERLPAADMEALRKFAEDWQPFRVFPICPTRDHLRKAGYIERWNPVLKCVGKIKPWRVTPAGRRALAEATDADR